MASSSRNWAKQLYWSAIPAYGCGYLLVHSMRDYGLPIEYLYVDRHAMEPSEGFLSLVESEVDKMKGLRNAKLKVTMTDKMEPKVYGGFFLNRGAEIQFPLRYAFSDVEHLRRQGAHIELDLGYAKNRRKLEVNSEICQQLFERILLTDSAKRFAIQRELQIANSGLIFSFPIITQAAVFLGGYLSVPLLAPFLGPTIPYVLAFCASTASYVALRPVFDGYLTRLADKLTLTEHPEYLAGARDYFQNVLSLNRLLRRIMGAEGEACIKKDGESRLDALPIHTRLAAVEERAQQSNNRV
ncbi:unnamed protein product, partial [Mesorhabditis spiculigera]